MVAWALPGVLPGVTRCHLECYLVLPGRYLGCHSGKFFYGPKISAFLNLKLLKKKMSPGNVTWSRACPCYLVAWPTLRLSRKRLVPAHNV